MAVSQHYHEGVGRCHDLGPSPTSAATRFTEPERTSPIANAEEPLREAHIADVDCDHQHFKDRPAVGAARVGATLGRQANAVCHHIV